MLIRLILAHLLGDFLFQSKKVIQWKNRCLLGHFVHYSIVFGCNLFVFYDSLHRVPIVFGLIILTLTHIGIDEFKISYLKFQPQRDQLGIFLIDQSMHFGMIMLVNQWWLNQGINFNMDSWAETILLWLSLGVANTYLMSILLYYIRKTVNAACGYQRDYWAMLLRTGVTAIIIIGGTLGALTMLIVICFSSYHINKKFFEPKIVFVGSVLPVLIPWIAISVSPLL